MTETGDAVDMPLGMNSMDLKQIETKFVDSANADV